MTFYEPLLGILLNGWMTSLGHYHAYYINLVFAILGSQYLLLGLLGEAQNREQVMELCRQL